MNTMQQKKPNFIVTKYRKKEVQKRLPINKDPNNNGRLHVPAIRVSGLQSSRFKSASDPHAPNDKSLAVKGKVLVMINEPRH